jgi:hypothetical protein
MNVKSIVVEQLDWNGTSKSLTVEPDYNGQLWVAFPTDYDEPRNGPFYFQNLQDDKKFNEGFAACQARRITRNNFFETNGLFTYKTTWQNIPTERNSLSYYALYLPEYAVPTEIKLLDPFTEGRQYKRTVFKDEQQPRYIIYLQCASRYGKFSFNIVCNFKKDKEGFAKSSYQDEFQQDFYARPEEWKYLLKEGDIEKILQFFTENIIFNGGNFEQNIVKKKNNPWVSGLFYLFVAVVAVTGLTVVSNNVHWTILPIVIVGGILLIGIIGALQLKNDDKIKDDSFVTLMKETYSRLPLLKSIMNKNQDKNDEKNGR